MKYLVTAISIVLLAALSWVVFFSGIILKKTANPQAQKGQTKAQSQTVVLETNFGPIKIRTNPEAAPQTSKNFVKLVEQKFYDGLTFHRVVSGFVIQGGDPLGNGQGGPGYTVPAEIKLLHKRGAVAMARLSDMVNPERNSSGSQFFIVLKDLPDLDKGGYTVFGEVVTGMEIVDLIANVKTGANDKPLEKVTINKAYIQE